MGRGRWAVGAVLRGSVPPGAVWIEELRLDSVGAANPGGTEGAQYRPGGIYELSVDPAGPDRVAPCPSEAHMC